MSIQLPPQHRAGTRHVYILTSDPAWDDDLIDSDTDKMREAGEDPDDHPVAIYRIGDSRFDLGAKYPVCGEQRSASDYLRQDEPRTEFEIQPLKLQDYAQARDIYQADKEIQTWLFCARLGLMDTGDLKVPTRGEGKTKRVTAEGFDQLSKVTNLLDEVGMAVFMLSKGPSDAEKKRFAS